MKQQSDDLGEWNLGDFNAMGERLKTFHPVDPIAGEKITQGQWAEEMGISAQSLSQILYGREMKMKLLQRVIFWLITNGFTADDVVWWETGYRKKEQ